MASCTAEEKMENKGYDTPGLGSALNGEKFDGLGSRTNHFTVEGKTTLINGKDVKPVEWTGKDTAIQVGLLVGVLATLPIGIIALIPLANKIYDDKQKEIAESKKLDFFNENIRDQFSGSMSDIYQSSLVEMSNQSQELTSLYGTNWKIEDLKETVGSMNSTYYTYEEYQSSYDKAYSEIGELQGNPQIGKIAELENKMSDPSISNEEKAEIKVELDSLVARGEELSEKYQQIKDDIPIMKLACEEIKDATTQGGVPSLEVLHIFNEHSTDRDGFKDIKGAEGYMSFLSDTYAHAGFAESNIGNIFADTDISFNVANMDVAESYVNLMELLPSDCNPREVFSTAMVNASGDAQKGLESINLNDFSNLGDMVSDFNQRFADGEDQMQRIISKIDNQTVKNHGKESKSDHNSNNSQNQFDSQRQQEMQNQHDQQNQQHLNMNTM